MHSVFTLVAKECTHSARPRDEYCRAKAKKQGPEVDSKVACRGFTWTYTGPNASAPNTGPRCTEARQRPERRTPRAPRPPPRQRLRHRSARGVRGRAGTSGVPRPSAAVVRGTCDGRHGRTRCGAPGQGSRSRLRWGVGFRVRVRAGAEVRVGVGVGVGL